MSQLRISYEDKPDDLLFKLNRALAGTGLRFEDDGEEHDGYIMCELKRTPTEAEALLRRLVDAEAGNADIYDVAYEAKKYLEGKP